MKLCGEGNGNPLQKSLNDPDNHDGVVTHLEPEILECEVKWALGSIPTNKASGYIEPLQYNNNKNNTIFKCAKDLNRHFSKDIQIVNTHKKDAQHH